MDPKWEFNANQFVDFNNIDDQEDNADEFFDFNMETGERVGRDQTLQEEGTATVKSPAAPSPAPPPPAAATPEAEVAKPADTKPSKLGTPYIEVTPAPAAEGEEVAAAAVQPKPRRLANLVTSWGPGVSKLKKLASGQGGAATATLPAKTRTSPRVPPSLPPKSDYVVQQQQSVSGGSRPAVPRVMTPRRAALKAQVEAAIEKARNSPRLAKLTPKRLGTNTDAPRLGRARTSSAKTPEVTKYTAKTSAAISRTPDVMRRYRAKLNQGQNVAKKMMDLDSIKSKLAKKGNSETSSSAATSSAFSRQSSGRRSGSGQPLAKPTLTKPVEFSFATSSRVKSNSAPRVNEAPDFSRMLRSYSKKTEEAAPAGASVGVTQPVPFNLSSGVRKRRHSADTRQDAGFRSAAEIASKFQRDTPDRFRSKPRVRPRSVSPGQAQANKLTIPHTPQLMTRGRSRPTQVLSAEEREEAELAEHQAQMFRAKAVGETVPRFRHGEVERRACTVPEPFQLHTAATFRAPAAAETEEKPPQFTAKPAPRTLTSGPSGVPERKQLPVVEPQSPAFALRARLADRKPKAEVAPEPEPVVRARPAPHRGVPVLLPPHPRKATLPEPFSFENRDKAMFEKKEEKIKQVLEEEKKAREFHAKPILKEDAVKMPARQPQQPTKVEPFKLQIEERCEERLAKWQEGVEKELSDQRKAALFKASEPKVLSTAPFQPRPSEKPLSEVGNFMLHSERRAQEREAFDIKLKQKEAEMEGAKRELESRRRREEEEEVNRMRKQAVPKAQPIRNYKPMEIRPSEKPLTLPASPNFSMKGKVNSTYDKSN